MRILVTGSAGFIGYHLVKSLIERGEEVIGIDNINNYYNTGLKIGRLSDVGIVPEDIEENKICVSHKYRNYRFIKFSIESDRLFLSTLFKEEKFDVVCHLAAQAGIRYSIINPQAYVDNNITGFLNILECCKEYSVRHLVYASSSSVYGLNLKYPNNEKDEVNNPTSLYAVTKRTNELMAVAYNNLYRQKSTGLRFFTVYGPFGRPDMAPFKFTDSIYNGNPINVFNKGNLIRDFTYIDDIIEGVIRIVDDTNNEPTSRLYNIGNSSPVNLMDLIRIIEEALGKKANIEFQPMQKGDVYQTYADISSIEKDYNFKPKTTLKDGIGKFVEWYLKYRNLK